MELGVRQSLWSGSPNIPSVDVRLTGYYTRLSDGMIRGLFTLPNGDSSYTYLGQDLTIEANQNMERGYIYGLSSALHAKWTEQWILDAVLNYQKGRIRGESPPTHGPHSSNVWTYIVVI